MQIRIKNCLINYIQYGKGKDVVLLHGWGQNIEMMKPIGNPLSNNFRVTIIDFPGFGESEEPKTAWTIDDYSDMLELLVKELKIKKPTIIGHSFGGRVAIRYSANNSIEKLVLFGSPCVRLQKELPLKVKILKKLKTLPGLNGIGEYMKKYIGSRDYKAASPIMREILVNTVNEDLSEYASKIEEPTLLIWGENDTEAILDEAKMLENLLPDGALIVLPGTHYAYLENINQVLNILSAFLKGGK